MKIRLWVMSAATCLVFLPSLGVSQESQAPKGLGGEQSLPSRYEYVGAGHAQVLPTEEGFLGRSRRRPRAGRDRADRGHGQPGRDG